LNKRKEKPVKEMSHSISENDITGDVVGIHADYSGLSSNLSLISFCTFSTQTLAG